MQLTRLNGEKGPDCVEVQADLGLTISWQKSTMGKFLHCMVHMSTIYHVNYFEWSHIVNINPTFPSNNNSAKNDIENIYRIYKNSQ